MKNLNFSYLLDFYKNVLPDRTANMLDMYYNEDLSLSEIADNFGITRQGVRDLIKRGEEELLKLEERIGLIKKIEDLDKEIKEIKNFAKNKNYIEILDKLDKLSEILYL
ncbi:MAG: sigma factor-like helix-turn-helix DNA-binding protein [Clostridia bacterium]|nr:DNA-binding protein [Oscillospiraceae bacterium]MDY5626800.1 sigma factor-like helix-turn-helix DNA-binding protein [Clostridia bacterium]